MSIGGRDAEEKTVPSFASVAALLLFAGCTVPNPEFDPGDGPLSAANASDAGGDQGLSPPAADAVSPPSGQVDLTPPAPAAPPLGQLCTTSCPSGEVCMRMEEGATRGICLRRCTAINTPCSVPDASFYSACARYYNSDIGSIDVCIVFCEVGGKRYPCPNSSDYRCKRYSPGLGACIAR